MSGETVLTNARLVLGDEIVSGTLVHAHGVIRDVSPGRSTAAGAVDLEGDLLAPGLIELHTDNLEKHFSPRAGVIWPNPLAAALAHDAQMAAAGVTTVYDALFVGGYEVENDARRGLLPTMVRAIERGVELGLFRADHRLHLRCELSDPELTDHLAPFADGPLVALASLMDHTPGQRQWRDVSLLKRFMVREGLAAKDADALIEKRRADGKRAAASNWPKAVELFRDRGIVIASHDDTTAEDVAQAKGAGCAISEFPTSLEAARAARAAGLATIGGAPNVVRGGSHSGGVSVDQLVREDALDALSSDYVPASLLQAVERLGRDGGVALAKAFALATARPAAMLGLSDRGRLAPGLRADLIRVAIVDETPVVRGVTVAGRSVM
ncbi:alpha-D-ribose 1-methylphosphonate 5-triphosphate diphosphatase [Chelatococcus sambhunathii]|uniref:Alpha-D-ribose 1-methylphosphonate 5-triphosphate diphosphatase n=1 Tax=Chelatococcus sambhunathii TaxID=363953 RepID=A0ABU1DG67_9HYPH|nr:alpha-D-ribose 1-methylphosphonate 5-triphosphate diphosphatase [Chelatococcus sambhunathii]MDR4307122.1 alpha-D-ribose 1-methylphosphonate 5-triphosphate diphosphatase [Chelatococcus sambhunathii]